MEGINEHLKTEKAANTTGITDPLKEKNGDQ
jgi:hypothetical protein